MHKVGLIGGTFDRFHLGHKKLINDALLKCMKLLDELHMRLQQKITSN